MDTGITEGIHYVGTGLEHWGDGGTGMSFPANDILSLRTASSDRLYINSAGNVGIGTTTPGEKLEVAGNILANATNVAINIGSTISLTPGGGHPNTGAGTLIVGGKTNGGYNYQPGVITLINQNPNIGAGADTGVIQFAGKDDATSGYVSANIKAFTTAAAGTGNSGGGIITLGTSPGYGAPIERFRITTSGNVGIGLTSPSSKLHVSSTTSTSLTTVGVQTESGTIGNLVGIGFATSGAAGKYKSAIGHITTSSSQGVGAMVFCVDGVSDVNPVEIGDEKMRISSAGNVGIGTTSPGAKLDVTGTGKFTGQVTIPATPVAATDAASKSYVDAQVGTADTLSEVLALGNTSGANDISMLLGQRIYFNNDGENIRSIVNGDLELNSRTDLRIKANNNGTAGVGLEFWNGGSEKMRITSSGNVGIGTTSPSMKLEVSTDARMVAKFTGNTDDGTGYVGAVVEIESNNDARGRGVYLTHRLTTDTSDSEWYAGVPYTGGGYSIGNAAYGTSVNSNTGPAHKDQSKLFITEAGNVGIGTTSPGEKLEVAGKTIIRRTGTATAQADTDLLVTDATAAGSTAQLEILGGNAGNSMLYFSDTDSYSQGAIQYLHSSDSMNFRVNASTAMSINSSRNVGIGTSSPNTALEVDGAISTTTSDYAQGTTGSRLLLETSGSGNTHSYIQAQSSGGTSNAEDLALQLYGGNVGIGTSSPGTKLHISAPGGSSQLTLERTGGGAGKAVLAGAAEGLIVYDDLYGPKMYVGTSGTYNGNVGIGTISPLTKLHIAGTNDANIIRIENTNTALSFGDTIGAIQFFNNDTTDDSPNVAASIYATAGASGGSGSLRFKTIEPGVEGDPATEAMIITNGGNVGIGTTSPSRKLHVHADSGNAYLQLTQATTGTTSNDGFQISMGASQVNLINRENGSMVFETNNTEKMRITSAGDTGIGVTTPRAKLDVAGGVKVANDTDTASANKEGTLRYRLAPSSPKSQSMVDMCMKTGPSSYAWVNIVTNTWNN